MGYGWHNIGLVFLIRSDFFYNTREYLIFRFELLVLNIWVNYRLIWSSRRRWRHQHRSFRWGVRTYTNRRRRLRSWHVWCTNSSRYDRCGTSSRPRSRSDSLRRWFGDRFEAISLGSSARFRPWSISSGSGCWDALGLFSDVLSLVLY